MISPLKNTNYTTFKGNETSLNAFKNEALGAQKPELKAILNEPSETFEKTTQEVSQQKPETQEVEPKENKLQTAKGTIHNIMNKGIAFMKGINNVSYTTQGIIKGVVAGGATMAGVAVLGKNFRQGEGKIINTATGIVKDTFKGLGKAIKSIPNLITKSPLENVKNIGNTPKRFYTGDYLKGAKGTKTLATLAGIGAFAASVVFARMNANMANADIDHKTNRGHIKES